MQIKIGTQKRTMGLIFADIEIWIMERGWTRIWQINADENLHAEKNDWTDFR